jgi:hypothetical protein
MAVGFFRSSAKTSAGISSRLLGGILGGSVVLASALAPGAAFASTQTGVITGITYLSGRVLFTVGGNRTDRPTCDCCNRWEFVNDPSGQALLAILLEAYRGGRSVAIGGTGSCQAEANDTEGVNSLQTL